MIFKKKRLPMYVPFPIIQIQLGSKLGSITFFFIGHLIDTIFDKFFLFVYSTRNLKKDQIYKSAPFINTYYDAFFPAFSIATFVYGFDDEICLLSEQCASLYVYMFPLNYCFNNSIISSWACLPSLKNLAKG